MRGRAGGVEKGGASGGEGTAAGDKYGRHLLAMRFLGSMATVELFAFRYRDQLTGKTVRSLYNAEHQVIEERHPGAEIFEHTVERRTIPDEQAGSAVRSSTAWCCKRLHSAPAC